MAILQLPNRKTWIAVECKLSVLQSETCCRPVLHHQDTLRPALTPYGACESQTAHIHLAHMPLWDVCHEVEPTQHSPHEIVSSSLSLGSLCSSEPSALLETKQSVSLVLLSIPDSVWVHVCCLWWGTVGLWWAIMTKMQGRPPHCLIADSTVTGMKHIWVFYRLKRKYISTNFSHITIFCFISSVEYYDCSANLVFPTVLLILCIVFDLLAYYFPQSASWQQHWHREGSFKHSGEKEQQQPT